MQRRRDLLAAGFAEGELRRWLRSGELVSLRRGVYLRSDSLPADAEARHALSVQAALPGLAADAVVSHVSAAVLFGLPVWNVSLARVHVTRPRRAGARRTARLHVHAAPLDPDEVVEVGGLAVTAPARTVVDIARSLPFEQAVCMADGALQARLLTRTEVDAALARSGRRPGTPAARRVAQFADGLSESVGESRSRVALRRAGLPVPVLQWTVDSVEGHPLGRVDFGWPDLCTVGEFDGRIKYGRLLRPGQDPGDAVFEEKLREDAIRAEGLAMVRWCWSDLTAFAPVADRLRRAFR